MILTSIDSYFLWIEFPIDFIWIIREGVHCYFILMTVTNILLQITMDTLFTIFSYLGVYIIARELKYPLVTPIVTATIQYNQSLVINTGNNLGSPIW